MAKNTTPFTVDATTALVTCKKPRDFPSYRATVSFLGNFGGGTFTLFISPDGGTTKIAAKDSTGTAYSTNSADSINIELGAGDGYGSDLQLYATLTGSTSPSASVIVHDNM